MVTSFLELWTWMKWIAFYFVFYLREGKKKTRLFEYDARALKDPYKVALLSSPEEWRLELPRSENYTVTDEIFFSGVNNSGTQFIVHVAKACSGRSEVWLYLHLSNGKAYFHSTSGIYKREDKSFRSKGLLIECLAPMRQWRIVFNGLLTLVEDNEVQVHMKINFLWFTLSSPYDFSTDVPLSLRAQNLALDTTYPSVVKHFFRKPLDRYEQSGQIKGTINIDGKDEVEEYLWGVRSRTTVPSSLKQESKYFRFNGYTKDGDIFSLLIDFSNPSLPLLCGGYIAPYTSFVIPIKSGIVNTLPNGQAANRALSLKFTANKEYQMTIHMIHNNSSVQREVGFEGKCILWSSTFQVNNDSGNGLVIIENMTMSPNRLDEVLEICSKAQQCDSSPPVVEFSELPCKSVKIAGGKGASLAHLVEISNTEGKFTVPNGVVVTCACYRQFIKDGELEKPLSFLQDVAWGRIHGDMKSICESTSERIQQTPMPENIVQSISEKLNTMYGDALETTKFAVRSSAVGEDSEDMSAAGQMETYLGVTGLDQIIEAVKRCWSSQFGIVAVNYKKNNGQLLDADMAVVIQEMVPSEAAGVMFTCDPVTCNPQCITITANYGLGESVVSSLAEPDTIILKRKGDQELVIDSIQLGSKKEAIYLQENGGTETKVYEEEELKCCLSDDQILNLGLAAVLVDSCFDSPRDMEWAVVGDTIYLLQSRPVTSVYMITKFELCHETDIGQATDSEYVTNANAGEVLPGAITHLTSTFVLPLFYAGLHIFQRKTEGPFVQPFFPYFRKGGTQAFNQSFNSLTEGLLKAEEKGKESILSHAVMIGCFGHPIDDDELREACAKRIPPSSALHIVYRNISLLKVMYDCGKNLEKVRKVWGNCQYPVDSLNTAADTYKEIMRKYSDLFETMVCLVYGSMSSLLLNMVLLICLSNGKDLDCEIFSQFADLLRSEETVESADVPKALKKLASAITQSTDPKQFQSLKPEDALAWLQETSTKASIEFRKYLETHGHRSYKEYDLRTVSWREDPLNLVKVLQRLTSLGSTEEEVEKFKAKTVDDINGQLGFFKRMFLKLILPIARNGVAYREQGKSMYVKHLDAFRMLFHHLASQLELEGYLPDKDLLYFLTLDELSQLLKTRSSRIVYKARQRQRLHPELDKMKFPEIIKGIIKPISKEHQVYQNGTTTVKLRGTPVCQGSVKGVARVAVTLEEAEELQPGEILITQCTDIAWSPYFPLLSGIVTERGGLCSHGAVIARECNLPCLVGVTGATVAFSTGDEVFLDAKQGVIMRVEKTSNSNNHLASNHNHA